jgi:hypothetical protein
MLLTRGIFPQIQSARIGSCEAYHGISRIAGRTRSVCDCRNFLVAGLRLSRRRGKVSARSTTLKCNRFGPVNRPSRLKMGSYVPIDFGDTEEFASVMEDFV